MFYCLGRIFGVEFNWYLNYLFGIVVFWALFLKEVLFRKIGCVSKVMLGKFDINKIRVRFFIVCFFRKMKVKFVLLFGLFFFI